MKVVIIHRKQRSGAYSIEELFHTIAGDLGKHAEVIEYEVGSRYRILIDMWRLWRLHADIYHITGDVHYMALLLPRRKTLLTVHDIYHYTKQLQGIKRWVYKWLWLILPIRRAGAVTAISEETRRSIKTNLGIINREIVVVPNCVNPIFHPVPKPFNENRPIVLQVGTRPNKNILRVIDAIRGTQCQLSIIGPLTDEIKYKLRESGVLYENYENLTTEEIAQRYVEADLVCFASLYEGFGMPIIEAQAVGRPLITSNLEPMKSVAAIGACLVDPNCVDSIRDQILRIISDSTYRSKLVKNGFANVERYSPRAVAVQYFDLYSEINSG